MGRCRGKDGTVPHCGLGQPMTAFSDHALKDRRVLVTGASSGIGRAAAALIARCGGTLVVSGRDSARLEQTLSSLSGAGHQAVALPLEEMDQVGDWLKDLATRMGPFDGIFHAAGVELVRPARLVKQQHVAEVFGSSVFATFGIAKSASQKGVLSDGASLVFMSSVAGSRGQTGMMVYSAAKAAIEGAVRSLSCEMASRRIRANTLAAGAVVTEMHSRLTRGLIPEAVADYEGKHLLGFGDPQDVANATVFLLSDASRWITGTTVFVDGGYTVR
jgi:NAD(P)-dependent dehydrogenase (short-subunit alcohol dehydrogenase family)